ncbi:uncharacterized protein LOC131430994 [Malaya genurostris]|uniref:uncharacterized protein LOC131430994 n=1 Tax=Malaya genurostris TaxID=325434 RepID=UPI0026F3CD50|nr:uncharacterized protein LOC131430994 [Malaya genurostris]
MAKIIVLIALVCLAGISEASPNFGFSMTFAPSSAITSGVSTFVSALNSLSSALSSLPTTNANTNANVTLISTNLANLVKNLVVFGNYVKGNITVALADTKTDIDTLFTNIYNSFDALNTFLSVDGNTYITTISAVLTTSPALNQVIDQVTSLQTTLSSIVTQFNNVQLAITNAQTIALNTGVPFNAAVANALVVASLGTSISGNFTIIQKQIANITTNVKGLGTAAASANSYIATVNSSLSTSGKTVNTSLSAFQKVQTTLNTTAITYSSTTIKTVASDLKSVSSKLAIYVKDATLSALVATFNSTIAPAINSTIAGLLSGAVDVTNAGLQLLYTQTQTVIQNASSYYTSTAYVVSMSLASQIMALGTTGPACGSKYSSAITSALSTAVSGLTACLTAEQTKAAANMDITVRLGQLALSSHLAVTSLIASCGSYSNFAKDTVVYGQALSCLSTMITSADAINTLYSTIVQPEFDQGSAFIALEADMANTRLSTCINLKSSIFQAQIASISAGIAACT